jgi:predicted phage tail protein
MRKVFLHGELGNSLGKEWSLEVDSVQEALWAIEANTSSLTDFFRKNSEKFGHYTFMIDGKDLDKHQLKSPIGDNEKSIHIMPQVAGGELGTIITAIVVSIVTGLIMQALFKPPKQKDAVETNSYMFGGTQNVAGQGIPVPLGYGRLRVGSVVISAATRHFNYNKKARTTTPAIVYKEEHLPLTPQGIADFNDYIPYEDGTRVTTKEVDPETGGTVVITTWLYGDEDQEKEAWRIATADFEGE